MQNLTLFFRVPIQFLIYCSQLFNDTRHSVEVFMLGLCRSLSVLYLFVLLPPPGTPLRLSYITVSLYSIAYCVVAEQGEPTRHDSLGKVINSSLMRAGVLQFLVSFHGAANIQGSPHVRTMLVRTNLDVRRKFCGPRKSQMRVYYGKMHGCKNIPLIRSIFSWDQCKSMGLSNIVISEQSSY